MLSLYQIHIHATNAFKPYYNHRNMLSLYQIHNQAWNTLKSYQNRRNVLSLYLIHIHEFHPCYPCLVHYCRKRDEEEHNSGELPESVDKPHVKANHSANHVMVDGHSVDTPVIDNLFNDVLNDNYLSSKYSTYDILNKNHQNIEVAVQSKNGQDN